MQRVAERARQEALMPQGAATAAEDAPGAPSTAFLADFKVIRRNGSVVAFEPGKISVAMTRLSWPCTAARARRLPGCGSWLNG